VPKLWTVDAVVVNPSKLANGDAKRPRNKAARTGKDSCPRIGRSEVPGYRGRRSQVNLFLKAHGIGSLSVTETGGARKLLIQAASILSDARGRSGRLGSGNLEECAKGRGAFHILAVDLHVVQGEAVDFGR